MRRIVGERNAELLLDNGLPPRPHGLWETKGKTYYQLTKEFDDGR